jgi:LPS sulfotransferase NodH
MVAYRRIRDGYEGRQRWRLWAEGLGGEAKTALQALRVRGAPAHRFVIFAQGRTGSTLLTSLLDSHPDIRCADEILRRPRLDPVRHVERAARTTSGSAYGFHVKCYQLSRLQRQDDWAAFLTTLHERNWKIIYLRRDNLFEHVISGFFAKAAGRYHYDTNGEERRPETLEIEPPRLMKWLEQRHRLRNEEVAALSGLPHIELVYERDLRDPEPRKLALDRAQELIGVPVRPLTTSLQKSVTKPLPELISNYAEIRALLADTPYAQYLPDREADAVA